MQTFSIGRTVRLVLALWALATTAASSVWAAPNVHHDRRELEMVLADLIAWLPGEWNSFPQVYYERTVTMPPEGEHENWHRTFARIDASQIGDVVFYGQINVDGRNGTILGGSQVLYKAWIDEARGVVVINGQSPADPERFENLQDKPDLWSKVKMRDATAVRCDFIWRRDGDHIVGVLDGRVPERQKYGPGTCTYISERADAEFFADAEWVLTPEHLWLYDINTMGGRIFQGRDDKTHIRLSRARPYTCRIHDEDATRVRDGHDRGFAMPVKAGGGQKLEALLLRADYPAQGPGLTDRMRLMLSEPTSKQIVAMTDATPLAKTVALKANGVDVRCTLQKKFGPLLSR